MGLMTIEAAQGGTAGLEKVGGRQVVMVVLGTLVLFTDGFDSQTVSFAAPALVAALHVTNAGLGHVFAANLFGMMIGALIVAPLADLFSRRLITMGSIAAFGVLTLFTILMRDAAQMAGLRFVAGLALGGAMPSIIVSVSEFLPIRLRAWLLAVLICGYSAGFVGVGLAAATLIKPFGWQALFILGGVLPLLLLPPLAIFLPESPAHLAALGRTAQLQAVMRRMGTSTTDGPSHPARFAFPGLQLFRSGMAPLTLAIWLAFFCSGTTLYFITNWLPLLVSGEGYSQRTASFVAATLPVGGLLGGLVVGAVVNRHGVLALSCTYAAACLCMVGIGLSAASLPLLLGAVALAGFFVTGSQIGLTAYVGGAAYPASFRATGLGWALAVTRCAGILSASLLGAYVVNMRLPPARVFLIFGGPELLAALALLWICRRRTS